MDADLSFDAWLTTGFERGWIVASGCGAHDGMLLSPAEVAELAECPAAEIDELEDEILNRCSLIVRLTDDE